MTKTDLRVLRDQIDTWALVNRPLGGSSEDIAAFRTSATAVLADTAQRKDVVLAGLRSAREMLSSAYRSGCETIGNAMVRDIYGEIGRDEFLRRFIGLAKESDRAHARLEALVLRVYHHGLPPEVAAYDPFDSSKKNT